MLKQVICREKAFSSRLAARCPPGHGVRHAVLLSTGGPGDCTEIETKYLAVLLYCTQNGVKWD